jgi:sterol desaturase/sphingolipid hydroxylase (fatty acid hydroxylase superfamily)
MFRVPAAAGLMLAGTRPEWFQPKGRILPMSLAFEAQQARFGTASLDHDAHLETGAGFPRALMAAAFLAYAAVLAAAWWALQALVPDQLTIHAAGHVLRLPHVHDKILGNAALMLVLLPSALWLECLVIGWKNSSARALLSPTGSMKTDIMFLLLDQAHVMGLVGRAMMLGASVISGLALRDWLTARTGLAVDASALPLVPQVIVYFGVYSFFDYWAHRLAHTRPFWPLHRYHHAAEDFCVINGARSHPAGFIGIFLINLPMPLLGAGPEAMVWANVIVIALGFLIHSRIESGWGWIGRYVIQSPLHHRLHHKLDMAEPTGFFSMMPVWDHLFGGWSERRDAGVAIGVDTAYAHGFWLVPDLLRDYCDFWKGLAGRRTLSPSERSF